MSLRELKFRIWDIRNTEFVKIDDLNAYVALALTYPKEYIIQQYINIDDIYGNPIYEGDIIIQYPDNYVVEKVEGIIYEIKYDKPRLPLRDIILHKGFIYYYPPQFWLRTLPQGNLIATSTRLISRGIYEIMGNILENPELIKGNGLEIDVDGTENS